MSEPRVIDSIDAFVAMERMRAEYEQRERVRIALLGVLVGVVLAASVMSICGSLS